MNTDLITEVSEGKFATKIGCSSATDPAQAVAELYAAIHQEEPYFVVFFCSSSYNLDLLATCLRDTFNPEIVGCTSAGQIDNMGYHDQGLVGVSICSQRMKIKPFIIESLADFNYDHADTLAADIAAYELDNDLQGVKGKMGFLLIDGLSMREELTLSILDQTLQNVPIFGGSAADDLNFKETFVFAQGEFRKNAAVLSIIHTDLPYRLFKIQHFIPAETRLVITESDPINRTVTKINGAPAAIEYAQAVGKSVEELSTEIFSAHPLMLMIGGEYYVRSIMMANPDHSMQFACAIDTGLVLRIGQGVDLVNSLAMELEKLRTEVPELSFILGCDCAFRKLEVFSKEIQDDVANVLQEYSFIGFNTYGEQINSLHVNQTLTGLAVGWD
jgi:hypothetical protein